MVPISGSYDDDYERDVRRRDDWTDHDKKEDKKDQCYVSTHTVCDSEYPLYVTVPVNYTKLPLFEDFTKNHNKTFISLTKEPAKDNYPLQGGEVMVTIKTRGKHCPIRATIPVYGTRIFQCEDFKSLEVKAGSGGAYLDVVIQKTFCICCNDGKDKKHDRDDCDKHDCCCN